MFNTSNDVVEAFKIGRVNAIVVDLATAFTLTSELKGTTIAGQFSAAGGDNWGLLCRRAALIAAASTVRSARCGPTGR